MPYLGNPMPPADHIDNNIQSEVGKTSNPMPPIPFLENLMPLADHIDKKYPINDRENLLPP